MTRRSAIHNPVGKVTWSKGAYGVMQNMSKERTTIERCAVRDFAAAICRQDQRREVTAEDVRSAITAMFNE